jgi:hypothetical protein
VTVSYGEYVTDDESIDFGPIVSRAEALAMFCGTRLASNDQRDGVRFHTWRREWECLETGKSRDARIATVHLFLRPGSGVA